MSSALVLGDRGGGLTTFVGLLYTAQVRLGIEEEDEFRFSADRESIRRIGSIYASLGDGRFPEAEADWEHHPLSFVFGFRRRGLMGLAPREPSEDGHFDTVEFQIGGLPAGEVAELDQHDAVLEAGTRRLLRSQIVLPLVDAAGLSAEPGDIAGLAMARYDRVLAGTFTLLGKFLAAEPERRARRMYPLFIVTKFDRISLGVLRLLQAPPGPPGEWTEQERADVGSLLLATYLPQTTKVLVRKGVGAVMHDAPAWFFSGLTTEEREGDTRIVRRPRPPLGGWEPEYPYEEFRALLLRMSEIAHRLPQEVLA
jgi:hypothetical protein